MTDIHHIDLASLKKVREWAQDKLRTGNEPPWAWYQYMKLRETLDAIIEGMEATVYLDDMETPTKASSRRSDQRPEKHLRLVADIDQPDSSPRRPASVKARLPM